MSPPTGRTVSSEVASSPNSSIGEENGKEEGRRVDRREGGGSLALRANLRGTKEMSNPV